MFGIKKNKNNLNDNLSNNKFVSDNNTIKVNGDKIKVKGDNITNYYGKLNKNDKIDFANKIAETQYGIDVLTRKILSCPMCKNKYPILIANVRDRYSRNGIALLCSSIDVLLSCHPDDLNFICNECKNNMEELRKLKCQLEAYNKILGKK